MRDPAQLIDNHEKVITALKIIRYYLEEYWRLRTRTNGLYTPCTLWDGPRWSPIAHSVLKEAHAEIQKIDSYLFRLSHIKTQNFSDISENIFDFLFKQLISSGYRIKGFRPSLSLKIDLLVGIGSRNKNLDILNGPKKELTLEEPTGVYFYADFQPYASLAKKKQEKVGHSMEYRVKKEDILDKLDEIKNAVEYQSHQTVNDHLSTLLPYLEQKTEFKNHELFEALIAYLQAKIGIIGGWIRDFRGTDTIIGYIPSAEDGLRFLLGTLRNETRRFLEDDKDRHFGWNIGAVLDSAYVLLGYWLPEKAVGRAAKFVEKAEEAKHVVGGRSTILCSELGRMARNAFGDIVSLQEYVREGYFTTTSELYR